MPTVTVHRTIPRTEIAAVLSPFDDIVAEQPAGDGVFGLGSGPFERYTRTVTTEPCDDPDEITVTQRVEYSLAVPLWGPLFIPLVSRRFARTPLPARRPWWAPPQRMDQRTSTVISLIAVISVFTGYIGTLLTQTNTFFKHEFGVSDAAVGTTLAAVRVGALLALVVTALADRHGRRRVLIMASVAACVVCATGAAAPGLVWLGASQTVARAFSTTMALIIGIIAVEETPAGSRAFAISVLTATAALGSGIAVMTLWVADLGVAAWRILYVIPLAAVPPTLWVGRRLPETRRFEARVVTLEGTGDTGDTGTQGPPRRTSRFEGVDRKRLALLAVSGLALAVFVAPASGFLNEYLRSERGFGAGQIVVFQILTNTPGGVGLLVGGWLADRYGRRLVGGASLATGAGLTLVMYLVGGWPMWIASLGGAVLGAAAVPALAVYGPELFPTGARGSANGIINLFSVVGSAIGLAGAGVLADVMGGLPTAMTVLTAGPVIVVVLIVALYPETKSRELEELNPVDAPVAYTIADRDHS